MKANLNTREPALCRETHAQERGVGVKGPVSDKVEAEFTVSASFRESKGNDDLQTRLAGIPGDDGGLYVLHPVSPFDRSPASCVCPAYPECWLRCGLGDVRTMTIMRGALGGRQPGGAKTPRD